jgi:hypothetical protein
MTRAGRRWAFEHHRAPLLTRGEFTRRLARFASFAGLLVAVSLAIGVSGYHFIAGLGWVDALLNASMILTGMGQVDPMTTTAAKLFAAAYALFSGVAFLSIVAVLLAPMVHRFLHRLHLEMDDPPPPDDKRAPR